jgi:alkylation response protein AidB-like acyl-CoA dehydrogenase
MPELRRSPDLPALLAQVDRVRPVAVAHAEDSDRRRTLAPEVVEALRGSGLFAMAVPRPLGGLECDPLGQIAVFEAMARADGAAGWSLMIGSMINALAGAYLPDAGAARVFSGRAPICAGLLMPSGVARRAPGGYRVSGRWAFGSGVRHADWVFTGAAVAPDDGAAPAGPPALISFAVPAGEVRIEDTWDTAGLRGSGSDHYRMEDVFVPEDQTCAFPAAAPRRGGAMFTMPLMALLAPAHIGFALGTARRALDEIATLAPGRRKLWTGAALEGHAGFHGDLGRAEAQLGAARAYALEVVGAAWDRALAGEALPAAEGVTVRLAIAHVTDVAAEVTTFAYRAAGAAALYASSPLQRCFRDVHAATQHVAAGDDAYEVAGRARLGPADLHPLLAPRAQA